MKSSIVWAEVQALSGLAAPVVITYLLQLGISLSTTVIVGQLPTATPLGAATLANMWVNSTGFAVIQGLATALDTLMAQAYGAGSFLRLGRLAQRGACILTVTCVPIAIAWWFAGSVLTHLGQDQETAVLAGRYSRALLGGMFPAVLFEVAKKYLQAQGIVVPTMIIAGLGAIVNACLAILLVFHTPLGLMGAPVATVTAYWVMAVTSVGYAAWLHVSRKRAMEGYEQHESNDSTPGGAAGGTHSPSFGGSTNRNRIATGGEGTDSSEGGAGSDSDSQADSDDLGGLDTMQAAEVHASTERTSIAKAVADEDEDLVRMPITWGGFSWAACFSYAGWTEFLGLGLPGMLMSVMEWAVYEASSVAAGLLGKQQLAAHAVLAQAGALSYMVPLGVSVAAGVRVGQMLGGRNLAGAKVATAVAVGMGWLAVIITASTFFLVRRPWGRLFSEDGGVQDAAADSMYMLTIFTLLDQYQCVLSGIMRGMGRQAAGASVNVVSYLGAELPLAFVLSGPAGLGLPGVWLGIFMGVILSSVLLTWLVLTSDWERLGQDAADRAFGPGGGGTAGGAVGVASSDGRDGDFSRVVMMSSKSRTAEGQGYELPPQQQGAGRTRNRQGARLGSASSGVDLEIASDSESELQEAVTAAEGGGGTVHVQATRRETGVEGERGPSAALQWDEEMMDGDADLLRAQEEGTRPVGIEIGIGIGGLPGAPMSMDRQESTHANL